MTECPKCGEAVTGGSIECSHCGVVFEKLERRLAEATAPAPIVEPVAEKPARDLAAGALAGFVWWGRAVFLFLLVLWTWSFARVPMGPAVMSSFLHLPDLVFHEAGHVIFSPFGRFLAVLGGSLFQCLVPAIIAGAFVRERQWFSAAVGAWWTGQNLLDVAPYIADARALRLVLLGGKTGAEVEGHDWEYLLTALGWTHFDRTIGLWTHRLGLLLMVASLIFAAVTLFRKDEPN
ncbi:MAG: zinc ribbon domain-containing protein [Vicinamibacterales bacterium]